MCSECDWKEHKDVELYPIPKKCDCGNSKWELSALQPASGLIYRCTKCDALFAQPQMTRRD